MTNIHSIKNWPMLLKKYYMDEFISRLQEILKKAKEIAY